MSTYATPPPESDKKGRLAFAAHVSAYTSGWEVGLAEGLAIAASIANRETAGLIAAAAKQKGLTDLFRRECKLRGISPWD
jgi:hypothetical protein